MQSGSRSEPTSNPGTIPAARPPATPHNLEVASAETSQPASSADPTQWVDRHGDALLRAALVYARSLPDAEDLVQETLLAAIGAAASFRGHASERTWLIGILRHKAIDYIRRQARQPRDSEPFEPGGPAVCFDALGRWRTTLGESTKGTDETDFHAALYGCLTALPPRLRAAFCLKELSSLSTHEICQVLNIRPTNLWTQLHRARLFLRECLGSRVGARRSAGEAGPGTGERPKQDGI